MVAFSAKSLRGKWSRRSILRFFIPLCTLACGVHLRVLDCASETVDLFHSSKHAPKVSLEDTRLDFQATAYCESGETRSGVQVSRGVVAADPRVLPLGSVIHVDVPCYGGVYQVMDTGRLVKGKIVDIYIPDYDLAKQFGRRQAKVTILRYGFSGAYQTPIDMPSLE
jgi:3D (Asp-Asp-Asp) domain-containing protein